MTYDIFRIVGLVRFYALRLLSVAPTWYYVIFGASVIVCIALPYLMGGLNFAIILSKKKYGVDIRDFGSGNAGMTNMRRTFGKKAGVITLAGDMAKTVVSCLLGYLLLGRLGAYIAGFFCIMGHMFPLQYKFKGGKGVACTAIVVLMTDLGSPVYYFPVIFVILLACFVFIVLSTKYLSLGSIMSVALFPLFRNAFEMSAFTAMSAEIAKSLESGVELDAYRQLLYSISLTDVSFYAIISVMIAVMVIFMHRANMKRMLDREEPKFEIGKKTEKPIFEEKDGN